MQNNQSNRLLLGLLFLALTAIGCAEDDVVTALPDWVCIEREAKPGPDDEACPSGGRFVKGACMEERCDAGDLENNCCPGQICSPAGLCETPTSRVEHCESDDDCTIDGQKCVDRPYIQTPSSTTTLSCAWPKPEATGECANGGTLFNGRCVTRAPCDGACPAGRVCNIDTNACESAPTTLDEANNSCQGTCDSSEVLVFSDPESMLWAQCCEVTCECLTLPPLEPGTWGRFADLALGDSSVLVSAYDESYGDLVMASYGLVSGEVEGLEYVDGIPSSGTIIADPNGPRGGYSEPGPNVGTHTTIALEDGLARIAYYDEDDQKVKFAAQAGDGSWAISDITSTGVQAGEYLDLAIAPDGAVHVAMYLERWRQDGREVSGVWLATSSGLPSGTDSWTFSVVDSVTSCLGSCSDDEVCVADGAGTRCASPSEDGCGNCDCGTACVDGACVETLPNDFAVACGGTCPGSQLCTATATGYACVDESTDCAEACADTQTCVSLDGAATCITPVEPDGLDGLSDGLGLFVDLELDGSTANLVYYDAARGQLRGAQASADGFATALLACDPSMAVGFHPDLSLGGEGVAVAYQGLGGETLRVLSGSDLLGGGLSDRLVDDGVRDGALNLVGAYANVGFATDGRVFVVYANQTTNDVQLAFNQGDGTYLVRTLLETGAYGSFTSMAVDGTTAWVGSYLRNQDDAVGSSYVVQVVDLADALVP